MTFQVTLCIACGLKGALVLKPALAGVKPVPFSHPHDCIDCGNPTIFRDLKSWCVDPSVQKHATQLSGSRVELHPF